MTFRPLTWKWWLFLVGSVLTVIGAIGTLVDGEKVWTVVMLIGVALLLIFNPIWWGLRPPKPDK